MARGTRKKLTIYEDSTDESTEESPAEMETTGPETINGIISNSLNVKMRAEPDYESIVIGLLAKGDCVKILGEENSFYKILTRTGKIAYVSSSYIKIKEG